VTDPSRALFLSCASSKVRLTAALMALAFTTAHGEWVLAGEAGCARELPCTEQDFVRGLLTVADETRLSQLQSTFYDAFNPALVRYTSVLVSAPLDSEIQNQVRRFVRLGDPWYPLNFGIAGECLSLESLEQAMQADGWSGGRTPTAAAAAAVPASGLATSAAQGSPAVPLAVWVYRKDHTQLWAEPLASRDAASHSAGCAGSILITYR
jgi:hypothetical protein